MGMKVTDKQGLFCVEMDAASPTSTYQDYIPKVDDFIAIKSLENYNMAQILYSTKGYNARFGIDNAYEYNDEMLSIKEKVFENFLLPKRDLFGFCDNFKSATFLNDVAADDEGSCVQSITKMEDAVNTFLDPKWYSDRQYLKGSSTGSRADDFNPNEVKIFERDSSTGQITQATDNVPKSPTYNAAECRVDNYVSEVFYRVYYSDTKDGLYTIEDIQLEFMIENTLDLDVKFCQPDNKEAYLITQRFGIEFFVSRNNIDLTSSSDTIEKIAATGEVTRSGNPGYHLNQPLIVAKDGTADTSKKISVLGTYMKGPDVKGTCLAAGQFGGLSKRIDFGKQTSSSCHVTLETLSDFKTFCQSETELASYEIFNQFLERFKFLAIFGNPNVDYAGDWIPTVVTEAADAVNTAGQFNEARSSCTLVTALEVEIMTS